MTDAQRQQVEIDRDEQWFAETCERSAEIDTVRIKRAVRIVVEEQWLARNLAPEVPAGLSARVGRVVRDALTTAPTGGDRGRRRVIRVWTWVGGGLAAAAAIGMAVIGSWNPTQTPDSEEAAMSFTAVFEEFQDDEQLDQELSELRDAFTELDQTVAHGWGDEPWEEPVDETSDPTEDGV